MVSGGGYQSPGYLAFWLLLSIIVPVDGNEKLLLKLKKIRETTWRICDYTELKEIKKTIVHDADIRHPMDSKALVIC